MKLGVHANFEKQPVTEVLAHLDELASTLDLQLVAWGKTAGHLPSALKVDEADFAASIDLLMTLGGDGTLLRAVRQLCGVAVPVIGVNLGNLGFMTATVDEELAATLASLKAGDFTISERTMIACRIGDSEETHIALNDVVLAWGPSASIAHIHVSIDDIPVTTYSCDGLIISTPTGSTGHSLSAGGPIVHPNTPGFVLNVICPHTMSTRPVIVPDNSRIKAVISGNSKPLILAVDGQVTADLNPGDELHLQKTEVGARFIQLPGYDYFSALRNKLNWRGSSIH
ncbi:MAG: NAD+ kinase [Kiritimatiellia bacterium]|jgi:NAD+ kinase